MREAWTHAGGEAARDVADPSLELTTLAKRANLQDSRRLAGSNPQRGR
jgi:hypothetical protein